MKKKWLLVMALAGVLTLTGACGNKEESAESTSEAAEISEGKLLKLGNYKGVEIGTISTEVTDEEMQEMIDMLLAQYPQTQEVEGKTVVEDGDTVNIDYIGRKDGEAFEGGTAEGYNLTIGSGSFIDGFEDGLIGKEVGGTYDLNLTFLENYGSEELAGEDVVFEVTVNQIVEYVDAEWTDEFVQTYTDYDSIDAYVEGNRADWKAYKEEQLPTQKRQNVIKAIIAASEFDCDEAIADLEASMKEQYESAAASMGLDLETYLYYMAGMTLEEFEAEVKNIADYQIKGSLVLEAIIEAENMSLTEDEYTEGLEELAEEYEAESPEAFEEENGRELIEETLLKDKAILFVVEQAVEV